MPGGKLNSFGIHGGARKMQHHKNDKWAPRPKDSNEPSVHGTKSVSNEHSSPPRNKPPNKSGLTPIRPAKSPGTEMKNKSGLTPVRPGALSQGQSKSPYTFAQKPKQKSGLTPIRPDCNAQKQSKSPFNNFQKPKQKSGLLPIKPTGRQIESNLEINSSSMISRRKSGLKPMKSIGLFNSTLSDERFGDISVFEPQPVFNFPASNTGKVSAPIAPSGSRRKSGLLPIKQNGLGIAGRLDKQPSFKPRFSIGNVQNNSVSRPFPRNQFMNHVDATPALNMITEDGESPVLKDFPDNISGLASLDDTGDMSVVIRPRQAQRASRIPLPRSNLNASHFSTSDTTKSRIPKRLDLHFPDEMSEDIPSDQSYANVLKDGSSRVNSAAEEPQLCRGISPSSTSDIKNTETSSEEQSLLQRKTEIETAIQKMSEELKEIEKQLHLLQIKRNASRISDAENIDQKDDCNSDSPFAHVVSPVLSDPMEFLTLDKSKRPESIYKNLRQSCSFLKTPQPSAFRKASDSMRFAQQTPNPNDPSMISRNVQEQLADLFGDRG